jgi:hypothetical protein
MNDKSFVSLSNKGGFKNLRSIHCCNPKKLNGPRKNGRMVPNTRNAMIITNNRTTTRRGTARDKKKFKDAD